MDPMEVGLRILLLGFSLLLSIVSVKAFLRVSDRRMAMVMSSFLMYTILSALLLLDYVLDIGFVMANAVVVVFLLVILAFSYLAILRR